MAGKHARSFFKVPPGTAERSFRPSGTRWVCRTQEPSAKVLGYGRSGGFDYGGSVLLVLRRIPIIPEEISREMNPTVYETNNHSLCLKAPKEHGYRHAQLMKSYFLIFNLLLLALCSGCSLNGKKPPHGKTYPSPEGRSKSTVNFVMLDRSAGLFKLSNMTAKAIVLPCMFVNWPLDPGEKRKFFPSNLGCQVFQHGRWESVSQSGDCYAFKYKLAPKENVSFTLKIDREPEFREYQKGTLIRLKIGNYVSEPIKW